METNLVTCPVLLVFARNKIEQKQIGSEAWNSNERSEFRVKANAAVQKADLAGEQL